MEQLVHTTKQRIYADIEDEKHTLIEVYELKKNIMLESLTDESSGKMPDVPRDMFIHSFHYVMNGFQRRVEERIDILKTRNSKGRAKGNASLTSEGPAESDTSSLASPKAIAPHAADVVTIRDDNEGNEDGDKTITGSEIEQSMNADTAITKNTQHHVQSASPKHSRRSDDKEKTSSNSPIKTSHIFCTTKCLKKAACKENGKWSSALFA